jgi:3-hydroxyisobutyrate dehydrogenase
MLGLEVDSGRALIRLVCGFLSKEKNMSDDGTRIGFIGLGIMGKPMALNLQKADYPLVVYNRTPGKTAELEAGGAQVADSPAAVAAQSDIVIAIVTDTPDVEQVLFAENGVAGAAIEGTVFIDMSTISPDATREFAAKLKSQDVAYLDAPVSGGDVGAVKGTLTIMVGGDADVVERCRPVFEAMGSRVTHVGPVGAGQTVKACNQILCAGHMTAMCEALTLASAAGLELDTVLQVVTGGAANSWALENLGPKIAHGDMAPGFMVRLIQKDLNIVMNAAKEADLPLPGTAIAVQNFRAVQAAGDGDLGTQAMITAYERMANRKVQGAG